MRNFGYQEEGAPEVSLLDSRLWQRLLRRCRPYWLPLVLGLLLSVVVTLLSLALPRIMQLGIDRCLIPVGLLPANRFHLLGRIGAAYGLVALGIFCITFLQTILLERLGQQVMHALRQELFAHLLTLRLRFFDNQALGRLVTRLTNDIQNMHEMFTSVIVTLFNDLLRIGGILVMLVWMNPRLGLVMALFLPFSLGMILLFSRLARERFRAIRHQLARLNNFLQENIHMMAIIQIYGGQQERVHRFTTLSRGFLRQTMQQIRLFATFMPMTDLFAALAMAIILFYGGRQVIRNNLSLGELVAFLAYMRLFFQPMRELSQKYSIVQSAMASAERIFKLLDTPDTEPQEGQHHLDKVAGHLRWQHVAFRYSPAEPVLIDINLEVRPGEQVALVGATGSGKSTLIDLLLRFREPDQGCICLDGHDIRGLAPVLLRRIVGVVLQEVYLLPATVQENIVLDEPLDTGRLEKILASGGIRSFLDRLPQGPATRIGEGGMGLSSGQQQLVALARILYRNPSVVVFDEATGAIDPETEVLLGQAMAATLRGRTTLIIAHRLATIRKVDRIVVMEKGRIVEEGNYQALMAGKGYASRQLNLQD